MGHLDPEPPGFDAAWTKEDIDGLFETLSRRAEAAGAAHRRRRIAHGRGSVPQTGIVSPAIDETEGLGALTGSPARASL